MYSIFCSFTEGNKVNGSAELLPADLELEQLIIAKDNAITKVRYTILFMVASLHNI
jgi:hypothetical protein